MTKRVCIVIERHPAVDMGGAQYQAHLLAEELARRPDVSVTYLGREVPAGEEAAALPYAVRCIGSARGIRRRSVLFDTRGLWRALHELRPHVIYQRMKHGYTGICATYARRAHIPFVFQTAIDYDLNPALVHRRWLTANLPFDIADSAVGNLGVRQATKVVVQTQRQAELLRRNYRRDAAAVVQNFQPLPAALPAKPAGPLQVLWVANLKGSKRPELFLDLAARCADRRDLHFVMVGKPGPDAYMRPLTERMERLPNFTYLGEQPLPRVNELMNDAHVFVNTSRFEGFPNTFIQAWARGAVVVSFSFDIDEHMEAAGVGFVAGELARSRTILERLADDPPMRARVAASAFEHVNRRHSLANARELADLILDVATDDAPHSEQIRSIG